MNNWKTAVAPKHGTLKGICPGCFTKFVRWLEFRASWEWNREWETIGGAQIASEIDNLAQGLEKNRKRICK